MKTILRAFALLALGLLLHARAFAAPNTAIVSADAQWVLFADVQALRNSTLGREFIDAMHRKIQPAPASGMQFDFQKLFAAIGNVTAYGANFTPDASLIDGALVIEGTGALRTIAEGWAAQASLTSKSFTEVTDLPFAAYAIDRELIIGFPPEPIILLGKSKTQVVKAREVFRGAAASLAQNPSSALVQLLAKGGNAYAVAASVVPPDITFAPNAPQSRMLQLVQSGVLTLGEDNAKTVATAQLNASSTSNAEKLHKIVQGLTAMMSLTETNDRHLAEFLQSATVERDNQTIRVQIAYSSERLLQMLENAQKKPATAAASAPVQRTLEGSRKLVEWKLDKAAPNTAPGRQSLADFNIENAQLTTGATLTLTAQRDQIGHGGHGMIDNVEILSADGGAPLRFEAEHMRLRGFGQRHASFASGGRFVGATSNFASAQFEFPGANGTYTIRVRYIEESSGRTTMAVHLKDPAPPPAPR